MIQGDKVIKNFPFKGENMFNSTVTINFKGLEIVVKYYCEKKIAEFQFPISILEMEYIQLFRSIENKLFQQQKLWDVLKYQEKKLIKEIESYPIYYIITVPCQFADMKFQLSYFMNHNLSNEDDNYLGITPVGSTNQEFNHPKYKILPLNLSMLSACFQLGQQQLDYFCKQITNTFLPIQVYQMTQNTLSNETQIQFLGFVPTQEFGIINCTLQKAFPINSAQLRAFIISFAIKSIACENGYDIQIREAKAFQQIVQRPRSISQDSERDLNFTEEYLRRIKLYLPEGRCQNIQEVEAYFRRLLLLIYGFSLVQQYSQDNWKKFELIQRSNIEEFIRYCLRSYLYMPSRRNEEHTRRQMNNYINCGAYRFSGPAIDIIRRKLEHFIEHNDGSLIIQFEKVLSIKRIPDVHIVIGINQITLNDQPIDLQRFQALDIYRL